jgi:hypothetical protein
LQGFQGSTGTQGATGPINIISNVANNKVLTSDGTSTGAVAEANLDFNGSTLSLAGNLAQGSTISIAAGATYAHAEGFKTVIGALGSFGHAEGQNTIVNSTAHAEGFLTTGSGQYSHAEGYGTFTNANGQAAHTEGKWTLTTGDYSHAEGLFTTASAQNSHAEGERSVTSGQGAHAEGAYNLASAGWSHAEGHFTTASVLYSHSEGEYTRAAGLGSHAAGLKTYALGSYSQAIGELTTGSVYGSSAAGLSTVASGNYSYAGGGYTIASGTYQHAIGQYNQRNNTESLFVIGNGTADDNTHRNDVLRVKPGDTTGSPPYTNGRLEITGSIDASQDISISGLSLRITKTIALASVVGTATTGPGKVGSVVGPVWQYTYPSRGGSLEITAQITGYVSVAGNYTYELRRSTFLSYVTLSTCNFYFNTTNTHMVLPTLTAIDSRSDLPAGTYTYYVYLTSAIKVDSSDSCTMVITEY